MSLFRQSWVRPPRARHRIGPRGRVAWRRCHGVCSERVVAWRARRPRQQAGGRGAAVLVQPGERLKAVAVAAVATAWRQHVCSKLARDV